MYGTTETSRAVSYFEVPSISQDPSALDSLGNIIPAGQGQSSEHSPASQLLCSLDCFQQEWRMYSFL